MTIEERADFSKYGKDFQEKLCQLILQDRMFCDQIEEVLDIQFLELKYLRVFVQKVLIYREKYKVHPTTRTMLTLMRSELDDENDAIQKQVRDYFSRIYKSDMEVEGEEYIKDTALDFCKKQVLKEAMLKSVGLLKNSSFDEISHTINEALKLGCDNNFGYDYIKDFEQRFEIKARNPVSTGWKHVDELTKGGLGKGELGVIIAPTGAGKSMVLVHLGAQAIKEGKNVVHYTLELSDTMIALRYDSCITEVPLKDLFVFKEHIYENVQDLEGGLIVKEFPTKSASTRTLETHLEKLRQRDFKVDMILVDYGDLLKPNVVRKEKRMELESIYEELRAIAQKNNCPVWTASQTNRSGLNAEVITMESISEAFNKCFVADFIFSVSRTIDDKNANTARMFIAKNRFGPDGLVYPLFMDTSNVKIEVLEPTGETVNDIIVKSAKEQADLLKEKYKEFKNGRNNKDV
jgi:RecA/RadA recombinase